MVSTSAYSFYDDLRHSPTATLTPLVRLPVEGAGGNNPNAADEEWKTYRNVIHTEDPILLRTRPQGVKLCHIPTLLRYTKTDKLPFAAMEDDLTQFENSKFPGTFDLSIGAMLAIYHFNNGIGLVVDELEGINERCDIRLTTELVNTQFSDAVALRKAHSLLGRDPLDQMCALVGPIHPLITAKIAAATGALSVPQISPLASLSLLSDRRQYPLFSRPYPAVMDSAKMAMRYFSEHLGTKHLAVLVPDCFYGMDYAKAVDIAASELDVDIVTVSMPAHPPWEEVETIRPAMIELKKTERKHIFALIFLPEYEKAMPIAEEEGLTGPDIFWLYADWLAPGFVGEGNEKVYKTGSACAEASNGIGILQALPGMPGQRGYERFLSVWKDQANDPGAVEYFNSMQPKPPPGSDLVGFNETDFFERNPDMAALLTYDSVVGLGLAACRADSEASSRNESIFTGEDHFHSYVDQTFHGASGHVIIDEASSTRDPTSFTYVINNVLDIGRENGTSTFKGHPALVFSEPTGTWVPAKNMAKFVYADGTTMPPLELPALNEDMNYISQGVFRAGMAFAAIGMFLPIFFACWTFFNRHSRVVKASQPEFLLLICLGCLVLASSIIPFGIDDSRASQRGCDVACVIAPWLTCISFSLVFAALFAKTWRVNKILKNPLRKRIRVSARDVSWPLVVILLCNTLVLSLWTALSPLQWVRHPLSVDQFGRTTSSVGGCASDAWVIYVPILCVINGGVLMIAIYQAYAARHIQTEFSEAKYIGLICCSLLQALLFGVPVLIIVSDVPSVRFFITAALIFTVCLVVDLLVYVPKLVYDFHNGESDMSTDSSRSGRRISVRAPRSSVAYRSSNMSQSSIKSSGSAGSTGTGRGSVHISGLNYACKDTEIALLKEQLRSAKEVNARLLRQSQRSIQRNSGGDDVSVKSAQSIRSSPAACM